MSETVDILLVEDSEADAELTLRTLRGGLSPADPSGQVSTGPIRVNHVRNGEEALAYLFREGVEAARPEEFSNRRSTQPRMVLLDLKMPRIDGLEVLARIKQDQRTRNIPVVVLTSSREERDVARSYRLGANSFIQKPVSFEEFREVVRRVGAYWVRLNQACPEGIGSGE